MKQNDIIKIFITTRKRKSLDGKRKWIQHRTQMKLVVKGEEKSGKQNKWLNVTFCGKELKEQAQKNIGRGFLYVKVSDLNYPKLYEITKDEETGKDVYPEVKIFGYESFETKEIEMENPFVTDEEDTEETDIPFDTEE